MNYDPLPELALSVRQPWAWAIIHAGKDIENRSARAVSFMAPARGAIAIHASKGMTREEYEDGAGFMATLGIACPVPDRLLRGGIVGLVSIVDYVKDSASRWFFGPRGLVLKDPQPLDFIACQGALGFFKWQHSFGAKAETPARWMLPGARSKQQQKDADRSRDLFGART